MPNPLILYEGAFDPPHIGHINALNIAITALKCQAIVAITANYYKADLKQMVEPEHRMKMCIKVFTPNINITTHDFKTTFDLVSYFSKEYSPIFWLAGTDWADKLETFHNASELSLMMIATFVGRGNYSSLKPTIFNTLVLQSPTNARFVSSTSIRQALKEGKNPVGLTKEAYKYIKDNNLYVGEPRCLNFFRSF